MDVLACSLAYVYNLSLRSEVFLNRFKVAKVVPIFKGGDHSQLNNCRPISLLLAASKILERITCERIISFINKNNLLLSNQFSFRAQRVLRNAVISFIEHVTRCLDNHDDVSTLQTEEAQAFDSINHEVLLHKLFCYGFRCTVYNWFNSYQTSRM